jgi:hypothetical protein
MTGCLSGMLDVPHSRRIDTLEASALQTDGGTPVTAIINEAGTPVDQERLDWVRAQLARFSYRNWAFVVETEGFYQPVAILRFATENTQVEGEPFVGESAYNVSDLPTEPAAFKSWMLAAITSAEMHEVAERVMCDGELAAPPHSAEFRVWSLGLYEEICQEAKANGDPYLNVLHAATAIAVRRGTVPPEVPAQTGCTDHLQRNIPRRLAKPSSAPVVAAVN